MSHSEPIDPLIRIENLTYQYDGIEILSKTSLDINSGDITILRWPSGSGKSTFLRLLSGIESVSSWVVAYSWLSVQDPLFGAYYRKHIWISFTDPIFFESSTARENIFFPSSFWDYLFSEEVFNTCVEILELDNFLDKAISQLSSWERERIGFTRMLVAHPDIIILDEPFSHLDERLYSRAVEFLSEFIVKNHVTLFVVTHDWDLTFEGANIYRVNNWSITRI